LPDDVASRCGVDALFVSQFIFRVHAFVLERVMRSKGLIAIGVVCLCASGTGYAQQTVSYTYDALGRLTHTRVVSGTEQGVNQLYNYDAAGNRLLYAIKIATPNTLSMSSAVGQTAVGTPLDVNFTGSFLSGVVSFTENGVYLGSTTIVNGQASILLEGYSRGTHVITVTYSGDDVNAGQTVPFTISVQDLGWLPAILKLLLSN
jgi:hypothetical protein